MIRAPGFAYPIDIGLVGDAKATLQVLLPLLRPREDRSFLKKAQDDMVEWRKLMHTRETRDETR